MSEEQLEKLLNPPNQETLFIYHQENWQFNNGEWVLISSEPYGVMEVNTKIYIKPKQR